MGGAGAHRRQPVEARPPQEVDEHGLGLVVHGVAGGRVPGQGGSAGGAGAGFEVRAGIERHPHGDEPGAEATGRVGHDVGFGRRARAQAVVDVDGGHRTARLQRPGP